MRGTRPSASPAEVASIVPKACFSMRPPDAFILHMAVTQSHTQYTYIIVMHRFPSNNKHLMFIIHLML
jgi:hypothetical protein